MPAAAAVEGLGGGCEALLRNRANSGTCDCLPLNSCDATGMGSDAANKARCREAAANTVIAGGAMPGELPIRPIGGVEPRCFRICGDCAGLAVTSTSTSEARGWSEEGAPMIRGADAGASATHTGEGASGGS